MVLEQQVQVDQPVALVLLDQQAQLEELELQAHGVPQVQLELQDLQVPQEQEVWMDDLVTEVL